MQDLKSASKSSGPRRRKFKLFSILAAVLIVVSGALVVMNLGAAKANGAPNQDASSEASSNPEVSASGDDSKEGDSDEKAPIPVEIARVKPGAVSAYISSTANLVAEFEVKVLSEVEGRVRSLKVDEGDYVRKGQELATLVRDDEEIELRKAELRSSNAKTAYERARDLFEKELISQEEYDTLNIDFGIANQELAEAQWAIEKTTFRAPFNGRVTTRMTQVGQHVRPGDELFQVTDFDPLIARIYLPEKDVLGLAEGREVRLRLNADESVDFDGQIRQISPIVDTSTGTVKITIEASAPPSGVRPGSFVTVDIVRETRNGALLLPREAVVRELQKAHVFVADGGAAQKRVVRLGLEEGDQIEALSGVDAGDSVIVAGQGGLKDGTPVKILTPTQGAG
jgi:membrane fusion protein (multidrug efflux system)